MEKYSASFVASLRCIIQWSLCIACVQEVAPPGTKQACGGKISLSPCPTGFWQHPFVLKPRTVQHRMP